MTQEHFSIIGVIGPAILLILLIWLIVRRRGDRIDKRPDNGPERRADERADERSKERTAAGTRELYDEEEARRREGTDDL